MPEPGDDGLAHVDRAADVERFKPEPIARALLERVIAAASRWWPPRFLAPPFRLVVVVGEERERLIARVAEALARHWGLGASAPRGLASEAVLRAPALVLVFSTVPPSESVEAFGLAAGVAQNLALEAGRVGLGCHRLAPAHLVPEVTLALAAARLGPEARSGELVTLLAVGWPDEAPAAAPGPAPAAAWIGDGAPGPIAPAAAVEASRPPAQVLRSPRSERVLAVDPYAHNRAGLEALLLRAGYQVEVFSDGQALLERVREAGQPDLYLVADTLPDTTGFELVRQVKALSPSPAPVVATTARRDSAFRIAGLSAGVDYYLRRPINAVELYTAARILLDRHHLIHQLEIDLDARKRMEHKLRAANGELERLLGELRTAQGRLVQQGKMAALGQLVAGVAHEINTPLAAVVSNNDLFLRCFGRLRESLDGVALPAERGALLGRDLAAIEELSHVTEKACRRITGIVRELRTFARLDEADVKAVDLHEGLESTLVLVAHLLKGGIRVERRYGELPRVECHPNQLNQVFMNLIVNACQAMGEEGVLALETRARPDEVEVVVADTGGGIAPDQLARIFDPGFTTKGALVGTGLGLSIVYQIVEDHGGQITVESEPGRGAVFTVRLPVRRTDGAGSPRP